MLGNNTTILSMNYVKTYKGPIIASLWLIFAVMMISSTGYGVYRSYSPIPFWDHWGMVQAYKNVTTGNLSLDMLFAQHNEHRIVFSKLLMFADFAFADGSNWINFTAIFVIQGLHALLLGSIISALVGFSGWQRWALFGFVFGIMFSAVQMQNLSQPFQSCFVGVFLFSTTAFWLLSAASEHCRKDFSSSCVLLFILALVVGFICTFTLANGILVWPLLLLIAWTGRAPYSLFVILLVAGTALSIFYFQDYNSPSHHTDPLETLKNPGTLFTYVIYYLSIPFQGLGSDIAFSLGVIGLMAAGILGIKAFFLPHTFRNKTESVLIALNLFIVLTAAITGLGRLHFGLNQALASRYATPSLIFWIALFGLALFYSLQAQRRYGKFPAATTLTLIVFMSGSVAAQQSTGIGLPWLKKLNQDSAITALLVGIKDDAALRAVHPNPSFVETQATILRELGLVPFHNQLAQLPGSLLQQHFKVTDQDLCLGWFDTISPIAGAPGARVMGWAWDYEAAKNPSLIVISNENNRILGLALPGLARPDVVENVKVVNHADVGWTGHVRATSQLLRAFAILADGTTACPLQGQRMLR